jgi:hypothetical protein
LITDARELTFDEESHTYRLDGDEIPSVSAIIEAAGYWGQTRGSFPAGAAERGKRIHRAVEYINLGVLDWKTVEGTGHEPYLKAYEKWRKDFSPTLRDIEVRVVGECEGLVYAGTIDMVVQKEDGVQVVDLKTGGSYPKPYRAQLGAYAIAYEDQTDVEVTGIAAVHVAKTGLYKLKKYKLDEAQESFAAACKLYKETHHAA